MGIVTGGLCEACSEGKVSGQTGTYKDWRGPAQCLQCPDVNMVTKCSNLTGCPKRYPNVGRHPEQLCAQLAAALLVQARLFPGDDALPLRALPEPRTNVRGRRKQRLGRCV